MKRSSSLTKAIIAFIMTLCLLLILSMMGVELLFSLVSPWWHLSSQESSFFLQAVAALLLSLLAGFLVWLLTTLKELRLTIAYLKAKLAALENTEHKD